MGTALLKLARPRGAIWVLCLPLVGYGYAHWEHALSARAHGAIALVVIAWAFLHAGTMWLNAALDRDTGPVLYGTPTVVPTSAKTWGLIALGGSAAVGALAGVGLVAAACAALSVAYSHPRLALKGHGVFGPAINIAGYGLLSPIAGFVVVGATPTLRSAAVLALFCAFITCFYFTAQAFQHDEDEARGYRTLVATHGAGAVARVARLTWWLGAGGTAIAAAGGWLPTVCIASIVPAWWVDRLLSRWREAAPSEADARQVTHRALAYGAVLLALAYADYLHRHLV